MSAVALLTVRVPVKRQHGFRTRLSLLRLPRAGRHAPADELIPLRIERGSSVRFAQPNFSAPCR